MSYGQPYSAEFLREMKKYQESLDELNKQDNDWIKWEGGECPVPDGVRVDIKLRGVCEVQEHVSAGNLRWSHLGSISDITAYRVVKESTHDPVNHPSHYTLLPGVEVIDVRKALFDKMPEELSYEVVDCWSRSWEYLTRMWGKNQLEDAKKARFYLDRMIKEMEK